MTPADHHRLSQQLCGALDLDDVAMLQQTGLLNVGGLELALTFDAQNAADRLQAQLDLGTAAAHQREWIWYRLLVSNYEWGADGSLCWSLTPGDNRAMLTAQHPFDARTTGSDVAQWLRQVMVCGQAHWQALPSRNAVGHLPSLAPLRRGCRLAQPGTDHWVALMRAVCERAGLDHQTELLQGSGTLRVDGVDMLLRRDAATPDRFEVHVDLGMEVPGSRERLWQGLLWSNHLMGVSEHLSFSAHPLRDAVVLTLQQAMPEQPCAAEFTELLHALAARAKAFWRDTREALSQGEAALQAVEAARARPRV